jgi:phosphatidylserine/phosphatidylglycerophosphate/cardiolipin synthase-like enzyme
MTRPDPAEWLLQFSSKEYGWTGALASGDGRPWGDGTSIAEREGTLEPPWDGGCAVTPMIGGFAAMSAMRDAFAAAIREAESMPTGTLPNNRTHVYLAGWRFNALRDISTSTDDWSTTTPLTDPTAIGYILRLMRAGVQVRMLLWYPTLLQERTASFAAHAEDHYYVAKLVEAYSQSLRARFPNATKPLGIVALDARIAELGPPVGSNHQKTLIIRVGGTNVAFCGGVDLAFTQRDAPEGEGDWQSGEGIPEPRDRWPGWSTYGPSVAAVETPVTRQSSELPEHVYGDGRTTRQLWHDQHVRLEGPVVATLEAQFRERWQDSAKVSAIRSSDTPADRTRTWRAGHVLFSSPEAFDKNGLIVPLAAVLPVAPLPAGTSTTQLWRTVPLRARSGRPFVRGEFTAMAGVAKASRRARELVWVFDQYFWSRPLARLLNHQLKAHPGLCVIVVLPPHANGYNLETRGQASAVQRAMHQARRRALDALTDGLQLGPGVFDRVAVYNLWSPSTPSEQGRGIYCHAKAQTYDGSLFVCGSCNLNRRSFTFDSETCCATLDPAVVHDHQQALWSWLFPQTPWPRDADGVDLHLDDPGSGAVFLGSFRDAAAQDRSLLIPDRWWEGSYELPNGVLREQAPPFGMFPILYDKVMDPLGLPVDPEDAGPAQRGLPRVERLDQIVDLLETPSVEAGGQVDWSFRRGPAPASAAFRKGRAIARRLASR